ncbi:orexin receptor type 2-like isoform X4 [Episyrphus balteatus]|uniref:orexin receptor type 2-like isoform X4 n=1 Tax=Episyrphus balteatus TaxID=286459 RepID=UPI002486C9E5|nr:orexin receptor type 2-like isoform X4 [Episyrphus balteatus]
MTLRRQNILYIVLIYLKIKSSAGYVQSNLAEVSLKGIEYNDAVKLWSSLTETKQNLFSSNSLVKDSIDPDVDVDRRKGFEEVAVDYNINVTSVLWKNASLNYALIDSEGRTSAEDNLKIEKIQSEEVDLLCAEGHDNNWNSTVANRTCFDDNLPCNATKAEYMQFLFDYLYPKTSEWILIFVHGLVFITGLTVSVTVSVLTLTFISVDRWYAICFPLRYRTKISRAIASVSFIWIVALLSDIPEFLALHLKKPKLRFESVLFTQCGTTWDLQTEMNFYLTQLVLLYILPLMLMMIAYFKIVRILWKSDTIPGHRESRTHQYSCGYLRGNSTMVNSSTMGQLRARRKAAKMLVAVVVMFATCYFPVHVFNLLRYTGNLHGGEITTIFSLCSHWLCYANSAVNPVIYNFMSGKFRREFRNALDKCRCGRIRVEDRSFNQSNPLSRLHNISPSIRSNYNLTSVRDITLTRESSRQVKVKTMQTTFVENNGNGHSINTPILSSNKDL